MEKFSINPSTNMMDILGYSGYTFNTAIADIIDNSISAKAKNVTIYFSVDDKNSFLYILDDGIGMTFEKLKESLVPGAKDFREEREIDDLGRYSLGLKSASNSFCRQLTVCSKTAGNECNSVKIDFDYLKNFKKREAFVLDDFEFESVISDHGTLVLWENFLGKLNYGENICSFYDLVDKLENSLSHIFGKYILDGDLHIFIKTSKSSKAREIEGRDPFFLQENKGTNIIYDENLFFNSKTIHVKSFILPTFSNLSEADQKYMMHGRGFIEGEGFYVYRGKRLIEEGGRLGLKGLNMDQKCATCRIMIDIGNNLDKEFNVNFMKSKVQVPNELEGKFFNIAKSARTYSRRNYEYIKNPRLKRSIKKNDDITVWKIYSTNNGIKLSINEEHPLVKEVVSKIDKCTANKFFSLITKTIPISEIQAQSKDFATYTEDEMRKLIEETYRKQELEGIEEKNIRMNMLQTEPFNNYVSLVIEYFDFLEGKDYDK